MIDVAASREETFTRLFHEAAKKYRFLYRPTPDLIDPAGKAFLASINYAEEEFVAFVKDFVGTAEEAYERFHRMAAKGDLIAESGLGFMYANGLGTPRNYERAVFWYSDAAGRGDVLAQTGLGYLYANGLGVAQDYAQAVHWYQKAADQKAASAQSGLGYLYANGLGIGQDYVKAAFWHRQAAENGSDYSQYCLGLQYLFGQGVAEDKTQAVFWFRKAAEQNNAQAIEELKKLERTP